MNEYRARSGQLFENESLAAEKSRAQPLHERDIQLRGRFRHQKAIALYEDALAGLQLEALNLAG